MNLDFENISKNADNVPIIVRDNLNYQTTVNSEQKYVILYITSGIADFILNNKEIHVRKNDVFFIDSENNFFIRKVTNETHFISIIFPPTIMGSKNDLTREIFTKIVIDTRIVLSEEILKKIETVAKTNYKNAVENEFAIKNLIYEIFFYIIKTHQFAPLPKSAKQNKKYSIEESVSYIKKHYRENITLSDLLNSTNYSRTHFIRLFKLNTGMNYTDYLNRYRIEHACRDLIFSDKNITEIATENGFNNIQYFSRIFKRYMNCSPKQYQKKWRTK